MHDKFKLPFWLTLFGVLFVVSVGASYLFLVQKSPLKFQETDFDNNGLVTFSELYYANSYGTRPITVSNTSCIEYYALKDGLRLKLVCNENAH